MLPKVVPEKLLSKILRAWSKIRASTFIITAVDVVAAVVSIALKVLPE